MGQDLDVSKNSGFPPKSSILIGFSIIFTIHFGGNTTIFGNAHLGLQVVCVCVCCSPTFDSAGSSGGATFVSSSAVSFGGGASAEVNNGKWVADYLEDHPG